MLYGVYMMTNMRHNVIYIGASTKLPDRIQTHKSLSIPGFTKKYRCTKLIYYEIHDTQNSAFTREQELKKWSRLKKDALIDTKNPERRDLFKELIDLVGE